jgi:hypothetical protein
MSRLVINKYDLDHASAKNDQICIITPIWKDELNSNELQNILYSLNLNLEYDHYFICPTKLDLTFYKNIFIKSNFISFDEKFFENIRGYNILMQSSFFYEKFKNYDQMLILQTDAFLVKNIAPITKTNFDYIGSPWVKGLILPNYIFKNKIITMVLKKLGFTRKCHVGNGGLSLRKVTTFIKVCKEYPIIDWLNEDMKFALLGEKGSLIIGDFDYCNECFFENKDSKTETLPDVFGFHALEKYHPNLYFNFFSNN